MGEWQTLGALTPGICRFESCLLISGCLCRYTATMPWHIARSGDQFCVIKDSDGSKAGCHPSRADAQKQLAALYATEKVKAIRLGDEELTVLVAESIVERANGLAGRDSIDADGMLFVRPFEDHGSFWMKDVRMPLLLAFYDAQGGLVAQKAMHPGDSAYRPSRPFKYVLELVGRSEVAPHHLNLS